MTSLSSVIFYDRAMPLIAGYNGQGPFFGFLQGLSLTLGRSLSPTDRRPEGEGIDHDPFRYKQLCCNNNEECVRDFQISPWVE